MNQDEIKLQREGIGVAKDMANNTFIKLFQNNQQTSKPEEVQSVQYNENQFIEESSMNGEDTQIIVQRTGKIIK